MVLELNFLKHIQQTWLSQIDRFPSISFALISTVSPRLTELSVPPPGQWLDSGLRPVVAQT